MSLSYSASAAPLSIGPKYASATSGSVSPIMPVRPLESPRAPRFVLKPCSRTTCSTVSRVPAATSGRSLRTRETVAIETPARSAMSRIVARPRKGWSARVSS